MTRPDLAPGTAAMVTQLVAEGDLASRLSPDPADRFPDVYATSRMVALMELAAATAMRPLLGAGELSVGVTIDVAHTAATPAGIEVRAEAIFAGMEGKLYLFDVVASDEAGEIGRGKHRRAIVSVERLLAGASRRIEDFRRNSG